MGFFFDWLHEVTQSERKKGRAGGDAGSEFPYGNLKLF